MSKETLAHLNANTLIGHTAHRGTAWHYRLKNKGPNPTTTSAPSPSKTSNGDCSIGPQNHDPWQQSSQLTWTP